MNVLLRGGVAGLAGTTLMSGAMAAARVAGFYQAPPPAQITARAARKTGTRQALSQPAFTVSWLAAHFSFGAAAGEGYALLRPLLPQSPILAGLMYGTALWAANYMGVLPALGLYPEPGEDSNSRMAVMIASHAVYGIATAAVEQRLTSRE